MALQSLTVNRNGTISLADIFSISEFLRYAFGPTLVGIELYLETSLTLRKIFEMKLHGLNLTL